MKKVKLQTIIDKMFETGMDDLEFGQIDQDHPRIIEQRRKAISRKFRAFNYICSKIINPYYLGGGRL